MNADYCSNKKNPCDSRKSKLRAAYQKCDLIKWNYRCDSGIVTIQNSIGARQWRIQFVRVTVIGKWRRGAGHVNAGINEHGQQKKPILPHRIVCGSPISLSVCQRCTFDVLRAWRRLDDSLPTLILLSIQMWRANWNGENAAGGKCMAPTVYFAINCFRGTPHSGSMSLNAFPMHDANYAVIYRWNALVLGVSL